MNLSVLLIHELCIIRKDRGPPCRRTRLGMTSTATNQLLLNAKDAQGLLPTFTRACGPVERIQHPFVTFELIGCSTEESAYVRTLDERMTSSIAGTYQSYLQYRQRAPQVTVWCLGRRAPMDLMPGDVARTFQEDGHEAAWFRDPGLVGVNMPRLFEYERRERPLERLMGLGLSGAYMGIMAWPYWFPPCIAVGMEVAARERFAGERVFELPSEFPGLDIPPASPAPDDMRYWPFQELVSMDIYGRGNVSEVRNPARKLLLFLAVLNHPDGPLSGLLYKLRADSVRRPEVLAWICSALRMTQKELDAAFEEFWYQGTVSCKGIM